MNGTVPAAVVRRLRSGIARIRKLAGPTGQQASKPREAEPTGPVDASAAVDQGPSTSITSWLLGVGWQDAQSAAADGSRLLRIEGVAWRQYGTQAGSRVVAVSLLSRDESIELLVEQCCSAAYNDLSQSRMQDRSDCGFVATLDPAQLTATVSPDSIFQRQWRIRVTVEDVAGRASGRIQHRDEQSSAGQFHAGYAGAGCLIQPGWDDKRGLILTFARRELVAASVGLDNRELTVLVSCRGELAPDRAMLLGKDEERPLSLSRQSDGTYVVHGTIDEPADDDSATRRSWALALGNAEGLVRRVHWQGAARLGHRQVDPTDPRLAIVHGGNGVVRLDVQHHRVVVDRVSVDGDGGPHDDRDEEPTLLIAGECLQVSVEPADWMLVGGRKRITPIRLEIADGRFTARFRLTDVPDWGTTSLPWPTANYRLTVQHGDRELFAAVDQELGSKLIMPIETDSTRIEVARDRAQLLLRVRPPLAPGERSRFGHRQAEIRHRTVAVQPTETIFLDSFDGKMAGDNPRAIADELARRRPELRAVWTVADLSVELPDGAEPVIFKSAAWWQALSTSRFVVTNCWLPGKFQRRDHQTVLQTWHGTPLKLLGFDRIGTKRGEGYRTKTRGEVAQWSQLISQNPYSSKAFRSAYGFEGQLLEIGYPRNDILTNADDDHRRQIRERLGIAADETVVLYAPTWRENAKGLFRELDFDAVSAALGRSGRLLIRGHANTIKYGRGVSGGRLLDVTMYPDLADLYLVSDLMITDYSSTMFDFSVTGKPIIFFAPDIDAYSGKLRGTYFDLAAEAPGPVLATTEEVIDALAEPDRVRDDYAAEYAAWQQKFNPYDDGRSSARAVDALLGEASGTA